MAGRWSPTEYNYNGVPIPSPDTRPDLAKPVIYWVPVIAPGNLMFYKGAMFPQWNGSAFASGLASMSLTRITFDGKGGAKAVRALEHGLPGPRRGGGARWSDMDDRGREAGPPGAPDAVGHGGFGPGGTDGDGGAGGRVQLGPADASSPEHVKSLIADNNCLLCHRIGQAGGDIAPSLNGVGTRRTPEQIRAAIVTPPAKTTAGTPNPMPPYGKKLSEADLKSLVHYLSSLPPMP